MTTDDKIVPIGNGYQPVDPPPSKSDVADLKLQLAVVLDELELLSKRVTQLTKIVRELSRKG
jgi:hypothetical protein